MHDIDDDSHTDKKYLEYNINIVHKHASTPTPRRGEA